MCVADVLLLIARFAGSIPASAIRITRYAEDNMKPRDEILKSNAICLIDSGPDGFAATIMVHTSKSRKPHKQGGKQSRGQTARFMVIASWGMGWDHVSVSHPARTPTWAELDVIYKVFFKDDEVAVQYHLQGPDKINVHDYCLHLWRSQEVALAMPPQLLV